MSSIPILFSSHFRVKHKLIGSSVHLREGVRFTVGDEERKIDSSFVGPFLGGNSILPEKDPYS